VRWLRVVGAILHPYTEYQVQRAKEAHRRLHPECAACGLAKDVATGRQNEVHHVVPVHVQPGRACDPDNLITLCRTHHYVCGHRGLSWKHFCLEVREACSQIRKIVVDKLRIQP
jgi:predicted restriction endonuclease